MSRAAALAIRLYRLLALAFPEDFLRLYGQEMIDAGEDTIRCVARTRGLRGLLFVMLHLLFDFARRLPAEHLGELLTDARHAIRRLMSSKIVVLLVALSTGIAIAVILQSYNEMSVVFHPVPGIGEPESLFALQTPISFPDFERYSSSNDGPFAAVAAYKGPVPLSIRREGTTERVWSHIVTPNYFEVLKASTVVGDTFSKIEESAGTAGVIISEGYWQRHFGGSHDVVGQALIINGESANIIGVAGKDFIGASPLISMAEIWIPTIATPRIAPELSAALLRNPRQADFHLIGRLRSGITPSQAEAQLDVVARLLAKEKGNTFDTNQLRMITLVPGGQLVPIRRADLPMTLAPAAMLEGLLLMLACTNASTLLLAKAGSRGSEITIRAALGASRRRMIKQLLTESVILAIPGGISGLALALFLNLQSRKAIANTFPPYVRLDLAMSWHAVVLGLGISVIAGILFGVVPALKASRVDLLSGLKAGHSWFLPGYRWFSSRNALVLLQVASSTAVVILVGIIAFGLSRATSSADFGFEPHNLYTFSIDPLREGYSVERTWELLKQFPDRLKQIPGIRQASVAENPPIGDLAFRTMAPRLALATASEPAFVRSGIAKRMIGRVSSEYVASGYFETLSVEPLRGRVFTRKDRPEASTAIVINATLAGQAWPSEDPIGRQLEVGNRNYEVIGVVNDFRSGGFMTSPQPLMFHLLGPEQIARPTLQGVTVIARGDPNSDVGDKLKAEIGKIEPNLTVFNIARENDRLTQALFLARIQTVSYGVIGLFGLMLSAVGLAGVTAYAVAQRTKEIGVRVALGATRFQILRVVSREGASLVLAGILVGQAGALALTGILNAWYARLYEVTRTSSSDPIILLGVPVVVATLTMLCCYLPARRALRIDPVSALRQD